MARFQLFTEDEPSEEASFIESGTLMIRRGEAALPPVEVSKVLLGTLELFLAGEAEFIPDRMLSIEVEADTSPRPVSFDQVENLLLQYESGLSALIFLATLIDQTNRAIALRSEGPAWSRYETAAKQVSAALEKIQPLASLLINEPLRDFLSQSKKYHLVRYGDLQRRFLPSVNLAFASELDSGPKIQKEAGEIVCKDGDRAKGIFVLLSGAVIVKKKGRVLGTIESPGEAFGELAFLLNEERTADVIASEAATFLHVSEEELPQFHGKHPLLFFEMARTLSLRVEANLHELDETVKIASESVESLLEQERIEMREEIYFIREAKVPDAVEEQLKIIEQAVGL